MPGPIARVKQLLGFTEPLPARPDLGEVATTADGRDITRGFVDSLPLLPPGDSVLRTRGGGDWKVYDEVKRDTQVKTCLQQRQLAQIAKEWQVDPGDSSRKARKAADHLRDVLNRIEWDRVSQKMLGAVFYGYAAGEILWAKDGQSITIETIKARNPRRFGFRPDGQMTLLTSRNPNGELLPPAKFWGFSCGADDDDDPYGLGLCHWLYWPVFFKRNGMKFWLVFLEKFGQPTVVGKYPQGATPEQQATLLEATRAIQTDSGIAIPTEMTVELLEAARSGTADYTALYDRMDAAIAKVILGHTGSTDATPGRLGGESNASEVRDDLIKADADLICNSFNLSVARWLTHFNDPSAPPPRVWRRCEESPDLDAQAKRDKTLFDMGFKPTLKYVLDTYGGDWTEVEPPQPPNGLPGAPGTTGAPVDGDGNPITDAAAGTDSAAVPNNAFAESATAPDTVDAQVDRFGRTAEPLLDALLDPVRDLLARSSDLGEFRAGLAGLYPQMDATRLAETLSEAFLAAELAGRYELLNGE